MRRSRSRRIEEEEEERARLQRGDIQHLEYYDHLQKVVDGADGGTFCESRSAASSKGLSCTTSACHSSGVRGHPGGEGEREGRERKARAGGERPGGCMAPVRLYTTPA